MVYRALYECASLLFSQTLYSYCFCMLSDFAKVSERKVWRVQVAHLHNAARALSSPNRCFQLSTNLGKYFFRYLWYCDKIQIECGFAWHWWNSTDLGLIDMFLINLNAEIVACMLSFRKSRHKPNLESTSKYGFSPDLGGKNGVVLSMRMQVILILFPPARVKPLYGAGGKESSGTGLVYVQFEKYLQN